MKKKADTTPFVPRWNYWRCTNCWRFLVTVDVAEGVTPFILQCNGLIAENNRTRKCPGELVSAMYPPTNTWPVVARRTAQAEWFVPDRNTVARMAKPDKDHVAKGGLIMRPALTVHTFPEE